MKRELHIRRNCLAIGIGGALLLLLHTYSHSDYNRYTNANFYPKTFPSYFDTEGQSESVTAENIEVVYTNTDNTTLQIKKNYTKQEKINYIYDYVLNVTNITGSYITLLKKTLRTQDISSEFDIDNLKTIGGFSSSFPRRIPPQIQLRYEYDLWSEVPLPVFTAGDSGRLGNKMGEYASLLALSKLYNASAFIHPAMKSHLKHVFPRLSLPDLPTEGVNAPWVYVANVAGSYVNFSPLEVAAAGLFGPQLFMLSGYPFEMQLFNAIRADVVKEFQFADKYAKPAQDFLQSVKQKEQKGTDEREITFVNFHIRRTDYFKQIAMFGGYLPNATFFQAALSYYRSKFTSPIFIAASDDRKFLKATLGSEKDVYIVPDVDGDATMAILSTCNHSIITVGSYGFWAGYLPGGEVIYPDISYKVAFPFSKEIYDQANLTLFHGL